REGTRFGTPKGLYSTARGRAAHPGELRGTGTNHLRAGKEVRAMHDHLNSLPSPGRRLREAWAAGPIAVPGVFNALVAGMAERLGYRAAYLSGATLSASMGVPDVGLLTLTEFVDAARVITQATALPLICDADTGFGEALNVERTVRLFEAAGVAG